MSVNNKSERMKISKEEILGRFLDFIFICTS